MLAVRKGELIAARVEEFDLDAAVWRLPAERTKTSAPLEIPLPCQAVELLRELIRLADGSDWLLPARKMETRMVPYISPDTVGAALTKNVRPHLKDVPHFTVHDFRRTARTHIEALGFPPHIGERCLNHKLQGVSGVYNQHDYFDERKKALQAWADLLDRCERGGADVVELRPAKAV
jgi:integrase